jgi:pimeloyl-ACP methyl ester carboxylesterase
MDDAATDAKLAESRAEWLSGASLLLQPEVSHFPFLQDPQQFNNDVLHFLASE